MQTGIGFSARVVAVIYVCQGWIGLLLLWPSTSSKLSLSLSLSHAHTTYPLPWTRCLVALRLSQERYVAGQVDSGDVGRPANSAVRAHVPHDGGRGGAVDGQAGHVSEAILGGVNVCFVCSEIEKKKEARLQIRRL